MAGHPIQDQVAPRTSKEKAKKQNLYGSPYMDQPGPWTL
jgi:hypothetical protein